MAKEIFAGVGKLEATSSIKMNAANNAAGITPIIINDETIAEKLEVRFPVLPDGFHYNNKEVNTTKLLAKLDIANENWANELNFDEEGHYRPQIIMAEDDEINDILKEAVFKGMQIMSVPGCADLLQESVLAMGICDYQEFILDVVLLMMKQQQQFEFYDYEKASPYYILAERLRIIIARHAGTYSAEENLQRKCD